MKDAAMRMPVRPVIPGFHPDPSICRVGADFFLVTSSFEYFPAVPIFHSTDLTRWRQIGHVLDRPDQAKLHGALPSEGIYAPTLRHHDGRFWMVTTNVSDPPGQLLVTTVDPSGPWSAPVRIPDVAGIDPDLAWTEDGVCLITWSGELPPGQQGILQARLNPTSGHLESEPRVIWRGTGGQYPEAPHLYRHDGWWYLLIAEGGTERGHAVTIARSRYPHGPFEGCPSNPILTARGTSWPVQNTGHADLVEDAGGTWSMVFLGARPKGWTPSWHVLGRETFAAGIAWVDGWPTLDHPIQPEIAEPIRETLSGPNLPHSWVSAAAPLADVFRFSDSRWWLKATPGVPAFAGRRQEHFYTRVQASVDCGPSDGGLELRIDSAHRLTLSVGGGIVRAIVTIGGIRTVLGETRAGGTAGLELRTEGPVHDRGDPSRGPDQVVAGVRDTDGFLEIGRCDGRYFSTEVAGGFTGRFVGLQTEASLTASAFSYEGSDMPLR